MITHQVEKKSCHARTRGRLSIAVKVKLAAADLLCDATQENRRGALFVVDVVNYSSEKQASSWKRSRSSPFRFLVFPGKRVGTAICCFFCPLMTIEYDGHYHTAFNCFL